MLAKFKMRASVAGMLLSLGLAGCAGRAVQPNGSTSSDGSLSRPAVGDSAETTQIRRSTAVEAETASNRTEEASAEYHFSMAQAYSTEGNPDRAIEEYKLALNYDPKSSLIYGRLANEYIKKGSFTLAMEACKEALQRDPKFIDARLTLAGLYSTARNVEEALAQYEEVLRQDPKHEEAAVYKAQLMVEEGRAADAVAQLKKFLQTTKDSVLAWYYLGRAEQRMDHFDAAITAYRKTLALRPNFSQGALSLGHLYESRQMNAKAVQVYRDLYESSQDLSAAGRLSTILLKEEKYKEAIPYLEAIESADPDDMNVRVKLGLVQMELKNYPRAIQVFQKILEKNPESDRIRYYLGSLYEEIQQYDQAIDQLRKISPESKLFGEAALHVGYLLKSIGRAVEAKSFMHSALEKAPRISGFYLFQASIQEEEKDVVAAIKTLETGVKTFPEDEKLRYYLGTLYDKQGEVDRSLEQMEMILRLNPDNVDAMNYLGYTWAVKGIRLSDAERMIRRALVLRPDNGYIQDSWGWYLFIRGRVPEAIVELEKAARLNPGEATILDHLADAYVKSNLPEKAYYRYREAAKLADDDTLRDRISEKLENLRQELVKSGRLTNEPDRAPAGQ